MYVEVPSNAPTFQSYSIKYRIEDVKCTARRLPDGTYLGFVLNSACSDLLAPCFAAFEPCFADPQLDVSRLIVGAVKGRLYVMEFCWLKSGGLTVRFGPYHSLNIAKRSELCADGTVYAFIPSDVPMLSATALCPGQPSDDLVNARFENILLSEHWYSLTLTDKNFRGACVFCASTGAALCGCPAPMRRRMGVSAEMVGYKVRLGKTCWDEFGTVKTICPNKGSVIFNLTQAPHSQYARVMDSGAFPFDYKLHLNISTSTCLQKHLALTGQLVNARRTALMPFTLKAAGKRHLMSASSLQDFAAPFPSTLVDSNKAMSSLSSSSSSNELISLIRSSGKRARVQNASTQVTNYKSITVDSGKASFGDADTVIDATSMVVNAVPVVTEVFSSNEKSRSGSAGTRTEAKSGGQSQGQPKVYPCPECGLVIKNKRYNLKRHIQVVHQKERRFECTLANCEQRFQTKTNLKRHISTVHKRKQKVQEQDQRVEQRQQESQQTIQQAPVSDSLFNIHNDVEIEQQTVPNPLLDEYNEENVDLQEQTSHLPMANRMFNLRNELSVEPALVVGEQQQFE